jgi:hypothetical protein
VRVKRRGSSRQTRGFHETEKTLVTCQDSGSDSCKECASQGGGQHKARAQPTYAPVEGTSPRPYKMLARSCVAEDAHQGFAREEGQAKVEGPL